MDNSDIFENVIVQYCDTETLSRLAHISRMHYSVIRENPIYRQFAKFYKKGDKFKTVCRKGLIHIAQWIHSTKGCKPSEFSNGIKYACKYGYLELAQWICEVDEGRTERIGQCEFIIACKHNQLAMANWLYKISPEYCGHDGEVFGNVCYSGYLEMAQWLYNDVQGLDYDSIGEIFQDTCHTKHLDVAKWLNETGHVDGDDRVIGLGYAVEGGYIKVVEWLLDIGVDTSDDGDNGLIITACENGHLQIAKLLQARGADIHAQDDCIFKFRLTHPNEGCPREIDSAILEWIDSLRGK